MAHNLTRQVKTFSAVSGVSLEHAAAALDELVNAFLLQYPNAFNVGPVGFQEQGQYNLVQQWEYRVESNVPE